MSAALHPTQSRAAAPPADGKTLVGYGEKDRPGAPIILIWDVSGLHPAAPAKVAKLSEEELGKAWGEMAEGFWRSIKAMQTLAERPEQAAALLKRRLRTPAAY